MLQRLVGLLVGLQTSWSGRIGELEALRVPDWRVAAFLPAAERLVALTQAELDDDTVARLSLLVAGLPQRFAEVTDCGVPDSLVHGDFHPGNSCGSDSPDGRSVLLDAVGTFWSALWRAAVPGCDPARAARLLRPVSALRQALVYRSFLDAAEPSEHVYHSGDPAHWLRRAAGAFAETSR